MCYDGWKPPARKMSTEILDKVANEIAPSLSIVIPYGGSEPLIVTWDTARDMARDYSIDLRLTTNVQFLDEEKFEELKDITETLYLSIDSHYPELFETIRPWSKPKKVFENLERTAVLAREHGVEALAQVVFMTVNAPTLPETIAYFGRIGIQSLNVLQLLDVNGRSGYLDPLIHFSADYVDWIKRRCIETAREHDMRLIWNVAGYERHDFRKRKIPPKLRKDWNHRWEQRMKRYVPGYCVNVYDRIQIEFDGKVTPCAYATDNDLVLGSLDNQSFDEIWNSPNARDLRRAMVTWDYPSLCTGCLFTDKPRPEIHLPFVDAVLDDLDRSRQDVECTLVTAAPAHMTRTATAPTIRVEMPGDPVDEFVLALALGGDTDHVETIHVGTRSRSGEAVALEIPPAAWKRLRSNLGYWWTVFALSDTDPGRVLRSEEIRCLVRHEPVPRIDGSTLRYPDRGFLPVVDLGGGKQAGWSQANEAPPRPQLGERSWTWPVNGRGAHNGS
jgi:radical SAM protein with 4Fe4S-binding SPASM domain